MFGAFSLFSLLALTATHVHAHACKSDFLFLVDCILIILIYSAIHHPSMYGFNVTAQTYSYDNRPVAPLTDYTFDQWWFHGHLDHPPNPGDFFELPAGKPATTELACHKGATSYWNSSEGGDIRQGDNPCPNSPLAAVHSKSILYTRAWSIVTYNCCSHCQFLPVVSPRNDHLTFCSRALTT